MKILMVQQEMSGSQYPMGSHIPEGKKFVKQSVEALTKKGLFSGLKRHAVIVCRGSSGAILGTLLSMMLPITSTIIHIKKDGENSHTDTHMTEWEYEQLVRFYGKEDLMHIIIDDHIASGRTLTAIIEKMKSMEMPSIDALIIGLGSNIKDMAGQLVLTIDYMVTDRWSNMVLDGTDKMEWFPSVTHRLPTIPLDTPREFVTFAGGPNEWKSFWERWSDNMISSTDKTDGVGQSYGRAGAGY